MRTETSGSTGETDSTRSTYELAPCSPVNVGPNGSIASAIRRSKSRPAGQSSTACLGPLGSSSTQRRLSALLCLLSGGGGLTASGASRTVALAARWRSIAPGLLSHARRAWRPGQPPRPCAPRMLQMNWIEASWGRLLCGLGAICCTAGMVSEPVGGAIGLMAFLVTGAALSAISVWGPSSDDLVRLGHPDPLARSRTIE